MRTTFYSHESTADRLISIYADTYGPFSPTSKKELLFITFNWIMSRQSCYHGSACAQHVVETFMHCTQSLAFALALWLLKSFRNARPEHRNATHLPSQIADWSCEKKSLHQGESYRNPCLDFSSVTHLSYFEFQPNAITTNRPPKQKKL